MRPLKSRGLESLVTGLVLARVTEGRDMGLPPNIPSSSLAELELVDPSGDDVGGGDDTDEEQGELVRERMVVVGERMESGTRLLSSGSSETPGSSRLFWQLMMGLKILFLLLAR